MPGELAYTKELTAENAEKRGEADPSIFVPLRPSAFSGLGFLARSLPNRQSFPRLSCQMQRPVKVAKQKFDQLPIVLISGSKGSPSSGMLGTNWVSTKKHGRFYAAVCYCSQYQPVACHSSECGLERSDSPIPRRLPDLLTSSLITLLLVLRPAFCRPDRPLGC
jgi:hypothetical protein